MDEEIVYAVIFCTMLLLFLFAVVVIVFFLSGRRRVKQEILLSKTMLAYEKVLREVESEVAEHIVTHMGREIHDNVGALHTAMNIQLENIKLDHPELAGKFAGLESTLVAATNQVRSLGRTLNGDFIRVNGLVNSLGMEVRRLQDLRKFGISMKVNGEACPLSNNDEIIAFRIFQEFSQNTLKHAGAANLSIRIDMSAKSFTLFMEDDGVGFEPDRLPSGGSGLRNIRQRAEFAAFICAMSSAPGAGTRLRLTKSFT